MIVSSKRALLVKRVPSFRAGLLDCPRVAEDPKLPPPPRLPQRAAIYIAPDGTVHFGALFSDLVPVAKALGADSIIVTKGGPRPRPAAIVPRGSDTEP